MAAFMTRPRRQDRRNRRSNARRHLARVHRFVARGHSSANAQTCSGHRRAGRWSPRTERDPRTREGTRDGNEPSYAPLRVRSSGAIRADLSHTTDNMVPTERQSLRNQCTLAERECLAL